MNNFQLSTSCFSIRFKANFELTRLSEVSQILKMVCAQRASKSRSLDFAESRLMLFERFTDGKLQGLYLAF